MRRAVPSCRLWLVRYWQGDKLVIAEARVYAPTKRFAKWNARDKVGWLPIGQRATASPIS